ncbi:MAG: hypothetical protein EP299_11695 [Acidobacteria bacterium]|nr:MAG: hypothetical protein EP299_11695 [Acidobacteriota bacterium]
MFAFALYDTVEHRLLLARDRFGIKPPVYAAVEGAFYFASEVRPLRHCLELAAERLARRFKLDLHIVPVDDEEFLSLIPETVLHYEAPFSYRPNSVPFLAVAKLVERHGVKAILSGEGSDEAFLGYASALRNRHLLVVKWPVRRVAESYLPSDLAYRRKRGFPTTGLRRLEIEPSFFDNGRVGEGLGLTADQTPEP